MTAPVAVPMLELRGVSKVYHAAGHDLRVLDDVSLRLEAGDTCAILGPSGSGKSTLLSLCAGIEEPSVGTVWLAGESLAGLDEEARARRRAAAVGFVFQSFQLLATLTALENVMVPLELRGMAGARARAQELLEQVGLGDRLRHYPVQLSGGEQQRVALARAFSNRPRILFADEPTGNLDAETGASIRELLLALNRQHGTTLLIVTHDLELARCAQRIVQLRRGRLHAG